MILHKRGGRKCVINNFSGSSWEALQNKVHLQKIAYKVIRI